MNHSYGCRLERTNFSTLLNQHLGRVKLFFMSLRNFRISVTSLDSRHSDEARLGSLRWCGLSEYKSSSCHLDEIERCRSDWLRCCQADAKLDCFALVNQMGPIFNFCLFGQAYSDLVVSTSKWQFVASTNFFCYVSTSYSFFPFQYAVTQIWISCWF